MLKDWIFGKVHTRALYVGSREVERRDTDTDTADTADQDTSDSAAKDSAGDTGDLTSSFKSSAGCGCTSTSSTSSTGLGLAAMLLYTIRRSRRRSAIAHPSSVQ